MATNRPDATSISTSSAPGKGSLENSRVHAPLFKNGQPFNPYGLFTGVFVADGICKYRGLTPGAKLLLGRLYRYAGRDGKAYPSMPALGLQIGIGVKQARRYVRELENKAFIRSDREAGKPSHYVFLGHPAYEGETGAARMGGRPLPDAGVPTPPASGSTTPPASGRRRESREESHGKKGESVGRSVVVSEPEKADRPTDNSLNLLKAVIEESGICAKLNDTPSRALLGRIAAKLNGNPPDALKVRIGLRFDDITGLGMIEGLAGDVAAAQALPPSDMQRARFILEHPAKHSETDKSWARLVLSEAPKPVSNSRYEPADLRRRREVVAGLEFMQKMRDGNG